MEKEWILTGLSEEKYDLLWLKYSYEDVRYIIVPDGNAHIDIINIKDQESYEQFLTALKTVQEICFKL